MCESNIFLCYCGVVCANSGDVVVAGCILMEMGAV